MNDISKTGRARRYTLLGVAAILAVVLIGYVWLVMLAPHAMDFAGGAHVSLPDYHAADPTGVPPELRGASLIERGEYLARAADCAACHTAEGGAAYAGGRAFVLPFGTLYSTNITSRYETGIGDYDADFPERRPQRIGRAMQSSTRQCPTLHLHDRCADAGAIKAYLFSLKPVHAPAPANTLSFPSQSALAHGNLGAVVQSRQAFRAAHRTRS